MQVRPRPVEHGHEVVTYDLDARGREVLKTLLVVVDVRAPVTPLLLDVLRHRQALHHVPAQAGRMAVLHAADRLLPFRDLAWSPDFTGRNVMQGAHDPLDACLHDVVNGYVVRRPEPSPSLSHGAISFRTGAGSDALKQLPISMREF